MYNGNQDEQFPLSLLQFNQNFTTLILSTPSGYSLVRTTDENFEEEFSEEKLKMYIIERLFTSSLLVMVARDDCNKLLAYHFRKKMLICHYRYSSSILSVKVNRKRLVVCVEDGILIHCILTLNMLHNIEETPLNRKGIMALSGNEENSYLAYPGSSREGTVIVLDTLTFQNVTTIVAHNGLLAAISFNSEGNLLATASDKGTVIRVFEMPRGNRLMEFRRGMARCASISSLNFSLNNEFLVVASSLCTVHIFRTDLKRDNENVGNEVGRRRCDSHNSSTGLDHENNDTNTSSASGGGWLDWMSGTFKLTATYLPTQVSEMINPDRAFVVARLTPATTEMPKIAAVVNQNNTNRLIVASMDGSVSLFDFDQVNGGEAHLVKTTNLLLKEANESNSSIVSHINKTNSQRNHRRVRGESGSSVDSGGPPATYSNSPHNHHGMSSSPSDHNNKFQHNDFYTVSSISSSNQNHDTLITEGLGNLHIDDPVEFPSLANNQLR